MKTKNMKEIDFFCILKVTKDLGTDPDPHPDLFVRGTDPRIWILNTAFSKKRSCLIHLCFFF
jgi:hypothetical protein